MKDTDDAPAPDPKIGEAALKSAQLGEQWLAFSKEQFGVSQARQVELDALTKKLTEQQLGIGEAAIEDSRKARERYETVFKPIEDEYVAEASNYGSPERQAAAAAEANADVQSAAARARETAQREATGLGADPNSGRFAAVRQAGETGTALAAAGAQNQARERVRDKGLALKEGVVNLGKGLPAQATSSAAFGLGAGSSAQNLNINAGQVAQGATGIMGQGFAGAQAGYGQQGNMLQNQWNTNVGIWKTKKDIDAANWAGVGEFAGGVLGILSDEELKEHKKAIPEGEALATINAMPVETWQYKHGVADEETHVGTYAQDFAEQTGEGDGHSIPIGDAIGLTMKAVQDIDAKVTRMGKMIGLGGDPANDRRPPRKKVAMNDNGDESAELVEA